MLGQLKCAHFPGGGPHRNQRQKDIGFVDSLRRYAGGKRTPLKSKTSEL